MGQYYKIVNLDKKQFLHPHKFGDGLKLLEFGCSGMGTLTGLTVLLADGNGRGGGDLFNSKARGSGSSDYAAKDPRGLIGSWAGDRIVVAGDYADKGNFVPADFKTIKDDEGHDHAPNLYQVASEHYEDISEAVLEVLKNDSYIAESLTKPW